MPYQQNAILQKVIAQKLVSFASTELNLHGKNIIDVGCGTGFIAQNLVQMGSKPHNITQVDINPDSLQHAKQFGRVEIADFNNPFLPSENFDVVFSSMALQWACNFPKTLEYLQSILSQQGSIFFAIPLHGSLQELYNILQILPFNFPRIEEINATLITEKQYVENSYIALKNIHLSELVISQSTKITKNQLISLKKTLTHWNVGFFKYAGHNT